MSLFRLKNNILNFYSKTYDFISSNQRYQFALFIVILFILSILMMVWYFPDETVTAGGTDLMFHANRFYAIFQSIEFGMFPFYINTHTLNEYGYAANLFYPDFMLIPFALFIPSIGLASSYKLIIFTHTVLCGILSYFCIGKVTKDNIIAFLFSLLYTFAIYRIIDFSYRGALGEYISFTFLPIVFWGLYEIIYGDYKHKWHIIAIGFTCLIYTHLLSAFLIFLIVCIILIICYKTIIKTPSRLIYLGTAGVVSLLLSSFFLFPMFEQLRDNSFYFQTHPLADEIGPQSYAVRRILWGMFSGLTDQKLRIETIGILLMMPLLFRIAIKGKHPYLKFADISVIFGFILIFAVSDQFPWYTFPFNKLAILQFPFRLLQPASFLLAFSGAIYMAIVGRQTNRVLLLICLIIAGVTLCLKTTGGVYQGYNTYKISNTGDYNLDDLEIVGAEYLPSRIPSSEAEDIRYRIQFIVDRGQSIETLDTTSIIFNMERYNAKLKFDIKTQQQDKIVLPLIYYKGYKATLDGKNISVAQSKEGLVEITVPESGKVQVSFNGTFIQWFSLILSAVSLLGLFIYLYIDRPSKREKLIS